MHRIYSLSFATLYPLYVAKIEKKEEPPKEETHIGVTVKESVQKEESQTSEKPNGVLVHFDPPNDHKDYLHRSGRTARAGATGTVVSLVEPHQTRDVERIHTAASITPERVRVAGGHPAVQSLAESGEPIVVQPSKLERRESQEPGGGRPGGGYRGQGGPRNGRAAKRRHQASGATSR